MPTCKGCGSFVSRKFARVLGGNDNEIHTCTECGANSVDRRDLPSQ